MGNKGNKWSVRWTMDPNATLDDPLELVIVKAHAPPARVRIEIWEADAKKHELDNYDSRKLGEDDDDKIATFEGTLEADLPRPDGRRFAVDSVQVHYAKPQGADYVKIRFEGSAKVHELPIPHNGGEAIDLFEDDDRIVGDGEFYEIYAKIFDADTGKKITTVAVHNLRRKLDVLLEVEPLNQASASMRNPLGKQILQYFHGGATTTANRNWGGVRCRGNLQMQAAGCSYASLTMVLRYLRIPTVQTPDPLDDSHWTTVYNEHIGGATLDDEHRPAILHAGPGSGDLAKLRKAVTKDDDWTSVSEVQWDEKSTARADVPSDAFEFAPKHAHWWPVRLAWALRQDDGVTFPDSFKELPAYVECEKSDGTKERVELATNWLFDESETATKSDRKVNDDNKPITAPAALLAKLGLEQKIYTINESHGADWVDFVKKTLDRGLPLVANIKSGRYLREGAKPSGHFVVIVGYRRDGDRIRFIINDPAGADKLQYACLFEDEVEPSQSHNERVDHVQATAVLYKKVGKGKGKGDEVTRTDFSYAAAEIGKTPKQATLSFDGRSGQLSVNVSAEVWNRREKLDKVRVVVSFDEVSGAPSVKNHWVRMGGRKEDKGGTLPAGDRWRFGKSAASRTWTDPADPTIAYTLEVTIACGTTMAMGPRPPRDREGKYNVLLGRRRFDSLAILFVYTPNKWDKGAPRFIPMTATAASAPPAPAP